LFVLSEVGDIALSACRIVNRVGHRHRSYIAFPARLDYTTQLPGSVGGHERAGSLRDASAAAA
jgi:hypothetical protein